MEKKLKLKRIYAALFIVKKIKLNLDNSTIKFKRKRKREYGKQKKILIYIGIERFIH